MQQPGKWQTVTTNPYISETLHLPHLFIIIILASLSNFVPMVATCDIYLLGLLVQHGKECGLLKILSVWAKYV